MSAADAGWAREMPKRAPRVRSFAGWQRYALPTALLVAILMFSLLRPTAFFSWTNASAVLTLAAPLLVASLGLTVALVLGEIDLSLESAIGLAGAIAVCLMSFLGVPWPAAALSALVAGTLLGCLTGALVVRSGAESLIITLGAATLLTGLEYLLTDQRTIYEGVADGYVALGQSSVLGLNLQVWIAAGVACLAHVGLERTEWGRAMYAAGDNAEASRLAGLPVSRLRVTGFAVAGGGRRWPGC